MIDVAQSTGFEIVETADARFVDTIFRFVVAVVLVAVLIDFCVDALIASIIDVLAVDASMTVKQMNVFVFVLMSRNLITC